MITLLCCHPGFLCVYSSFLNSIHLKPLFYVVSNIMCALLERVLGFRSGWFFDWEAECTLCTIMARRNLEGICWRYEKRKSVHAYHFLVRACLFHDMSWWIPAFAFFSVSRLHTKAPNFVLSLRSEQRVLQCDMLFKLVLISFSSSSLWQMSINQTMSTR